MGFQLKLFAFCAFLQLSIRFSHGKNVTVKVIGLIHCKDCIRHDFSSSQEFSGINVFIYCKSGKSETNTLGNGPVDREGKFNVTLSSEFTKHEYSMDGCFAQLQSLSTLPCPLQSAQTASVKILHTEHNTTRAAHNTPMILKFSPITCQSAFFLSHPKFTFFHTSPPPPGPPPAPASAPLYLPPTQAPTFQSPQNPPNHPTFESPASAPLYLPPTTAPVFQSPQPPPNPTFESPSPSPTPIYIAPPQIPPPISKQLPKPPKAFHQTPFLPTPIPPPIPPTHHKEPHSQTPAAPPIPLSKPPTPLAPSPSASPPPPLPKHEKSIPHPPNQRKFNPIPRAPPVPQLPPIPPVPRKYFNPPNSKSQPPHSS